MVLGIDIDDTISDTFEKLMTYAQEYTIDYLKREPILREESCNTHLYVEFLHNWTREETENFFKLYYVKVINEVIPKSLAIKYLNKIHDNGNKIILITARDTTDYCNTNELTQKWIEKYKIPCDKLIVDAHDKAKICKEEQIELFIDDSFNNCKEVSENGIRTFLMDSKANSGMKMDRVERVFSWPHIYEKIIS